MNEAKDRFRYERKFLVQSHSHRVVEAVVRMHPALFRQAYPDRCVCNVYFDDVNLQSLKDNIDGIRDRSKTRIRWYGDIRGVASTPKLEFKIRRGLVGTKEIHALAAIDTRNGQIERAVDEQLRGSALPQVIALRMSLQRPTLLNWYWRKYFVSADGRFRITVDSDLHFYPARRPWRRGPALHASATVLELKYSRADNRTACELAQGLGFRLTRNSKYLTGMRLLYGASDLH